ncbi:hypothetical protein HYC85_020184 [Camellia sinensis]|uniref:Uncharacterized protein n=1 Tax=Camellia sinensis TaxID=4442 RepID=A0A7J7GP11_CAMSI|nr:hypothetical protein HYC85_020184 [Camellia sinensis]
MACESSSTALSYHRLAINNGHCLLLFSMVIMGVDEFGSGCGRELGCGVEIGY